MAAAGVYERAVSQSPDPCRGGQEGPKGLSEGPQGPSQQGGLEARNGHGRTDGLKRPTQPTGHEEERPEDKRARKDPLPQGGPKGTDGEDQATNSGWPEDGWEEHMLDEYPNEGSIFVASPSFDPFSQDQREADNMHGDSSTMATAPVPAQAPEPGKRREHLGPTVPPQAPENLAKGIQDGSI